MTFDSNQERGFAAVQAWERPQIAIYGMGYIGLPTALAFTEAGKQVYGVDINPDVVAAIQSGDSHIAEEGIPERLRTALSKGLLKVSVDPSPAEVHLIAVPTPATEGRQADLCYVEAAATTVASVLRKGDMVIIESTVPPGTCERVVGPIIERETGLRYGQDYDLVHCPERVIPGQIFEELVKNDRVIGGTNRAAAERAADLYRTFVEGDLLLTDAVTAELAKLMENTYRDVNIALANEFAAICEKVGANVFDAIALANRHPRVDILRPGIGVGGHCIPVDPWFLAQSAPECSDLIQTAREVNLGRTERIAERISKFLWQSKFRSAALLGLAYKADVDDFRESPAIEIVRAVREQWRGTLYVCDPMASSLPSALQDLDIVFAPAETAVEQVEALVPLVGHRAFLDLSFERLPDTAIFDPAGIWHGRVEMAAGRARVKA